MVAALGPVEAMEADRAAGFFQCGDGNAEMFEPGATGRGQRDRLTIGDEALGRQRTEEGYARFAG